MPSDELFSGFANLRHQLLNTFLNRFVNDRWLRFWGEISLLESIVRSAFNKLIGEVYTSNNVENAHREMNKSGLMSPIECSIKWE